MKSIKLGISNTQATKMNIDIAKALTIILIIHIFKYTIDNNANEEFLNESTLKLILAIVVALIIYHIAIARFIEKDEN